MTDEVTTNAVNAVEDLMNQDLDRRFEADRENNMLEEDEYIQIAGLTNIPTKLLLFESFKKMSEDQKTEIHKLFRCGLPLNNIVREIVKRTATFNVTGEYDD